MARSHARLLLTIWADPQWRALPRDAQWFYLLVLSQPQLNHAGVLQVPRHGWVHLAADDDAEKAIGAALDVLKERRYLVVDDETDELLIRSYIRNDGVADSPNTLKAALAAALAVQSPLVRAALYVELARLDRAAIEAKNPSNPKHVHPVVVYDRALAALEPQPGQLPPNGRKSITPSDGYGDGYGEGIGEPPGEGEGEGEGVTSVATHLQRQKTHTSGSKRERVRDTPPDPPDDGEPPAEVGAAIRDARATVRRHDRRDRQSWLRDGWRSPRVRAIVAAFSESGAAPLSRKLDTEWSMEITRWIDTYPDDVIATALREQRDAGFASPRAFEKFLTAAANRRPTPPPTSRTTAARDSTAAAFAAYRTDRPLPPARPVRELPLAQAEGT
jgi:hypothetical protein